jgi:hypothetical protein
MKEGGFNAGFPYLRDNQAKTSTVTHFTERSDYDTVKQTSDADTKSQDDG